MSCKLVQLPMPAPGSPMTPPPFPHCPAASASPMAGLGVTLLHGLTCSPRSHQSLGPAWVGDGAWLPTGLCKSSQFRGGKQREGGSCVVSRARKHLGGGQRCQTHCLGERCVWWLRSGGFREPWGCPGGEEAVGAPPMVPPAT